MAPKSSRTTDPVAYRSGALCDAINKESVKDGARALAQWGAKLDRPPKDAKLVKVDALGINVEYIYVVQFLKSTKPKTVRIEFSDFLEPLQSSETKSLPRGHTKKAVTVKDGPEAKLVVKRLVNHALRQVGFIEGKLTRAQVSEYETRTPILYAPSWDFLLPLIVLGCAYVLYSPFWRNTLLSHKFRTYLFDRIGGEEGVGMAKYALRVVGQVHAIESALMSTIAIRRGSPPRATLAWVLATFFIGFTCFPNFFKLNPLPVRYKEDKEDGQGK